MRPLASNLRILTRPLRLFPIHRSFSAKTAEFVTIGAQGNPITRTINIWVGEPHEAFVLLPTDIGNAMKAGCIWQDSLSLFEDPQTCSLTFYHDTQHFAPGSSHYPRLMIHQDLPRQSDANTSPATLHLFGATHTIALDGTPDAEFAEKSRDTLHEMKPVIDNLKER